MNDETITIPGAGYQLAFPPCPECLLTIERSSEATPFPGQRTDCYVCRNRINVVRTEKTEGSVFDRYSSLAHHDERINDWKLAGVLFSTSLESRWMTRWLEKNALTGFDTRREHGADYVEFVKEGPVEAEADVYVKLGEGIFGRVVPTSNPV